MVRPSMSGILLTMTVRALCAACKKVAYAAGGDRPYLVSGADDRLVKVRGLVVWGGGFGRFRMSRVLGV